MGGVQQAVVPTAALVLGWALGKLGSRAGSKAKKAPPAAASPSPDAGAAQGGGDGTSEAWDAESFKRFVKYKTQDNGETVYWYMSGELFSYPDGELLAKVEGLDATRALVETDSAVDQLSRKLFLFRDAETGAPLAQFNGEDVSALQVPYQHVRYTLLSEGRLGMQVTQGAGENVTHLSGSSISVRRLVGTGGTRAYSCPVFLNLDAGETSYQSFENYDYFDTGAAGGHRHCSWVRFGETQPFTSNGVMHVLCSRLDKFDGLPSSIREYVDEHAPQWREAPKDLSEVQALQQQEQA